MLLFFLIFIQRNAQNRDKLIEEQNDIGFLF
jgi:hypothetical protein